MPGICPLPRNIEKEVMGTMAFKKMGGKLDKEDIADKKKGIYSKKEELSEKAKKKGKKKK